MGIKKITIERRFATGVAKLIMQKIVCDVLVIGGGETGIRAAVEARRSGAFNVLLATKGEFGTAGVMFSKLTYGWDMQSATGENDPTDSKSVHLHDIMSAAQGTCSENLARILTREAPDRLRDLVDVFGLSLVLDDTGKPRQVYGCFSTKNRSYQFTHPEVIKEKMANSIEEFGISLIDNIMIVDIVIKNGRCVGVIGIDKKGELIEIITGAVVLSAGGATGMFKHNFASEGMSGDGYALALRTGCTLANMEFMQFGLGVLAPTYKALFLDRLMYLKPIIEFKQKHDFPCSIEKMMTVHSKHFPFSCIDESCFLDVAIFKETLENGGMGVAVDLSVIPKHKLEEIPVWDLYYNYFDKEHNPYDNKLWITPFAHACNGGVIIDENAATSIKGLFAAGEMTTGPHGANRLGGNMHAACQVFGTRAGANAAEYAKEHKANSSVVLSYKLPEGREKQTQFDFRRNKETLGDILWTNLNVIRDEKGLKDAQHEIILIQEQLNDYIPKKEKLWEYYEVRNSLLVSSAMLNAALERKESRGSHYRRDYPHTDDRQYIVKSSLDNEHVKTWTSDEF